MFGKKFDRVAVSDGIGLGQILHGLDEQALAINVAGIGRALAAFAPNFGRNRDGKNFGHAIRVQYEFLKLPLQYTARSGFFSPYFEPLRTPAPQPWGDMNLVLLLVFSLKTESEIFSFTLMSVYLARR